MTPEEFEKKYMARFNAQQREAVKAVDGAVLLLAVPGSGKTTVLVTRLGYMVLCRGIDPKNILTMTYTVAATREMKQRFADLFGEDYARNMEFRTINGVSAKIIDYYSRNFGKGQSFELLEDEGELSRLLRRIYQEVNGEFPDESTIKDIRTAITYAKNMMLKQEALEDLDIGVKNLPTIYERYCTTLTRSKQMDYDDQMVYARKILLAYPTVLDYLQSQYRFICVDESQDTSKIQHDIIRMIAGKTGNIFMVGDEDQSIYGFRAAYPDALMEFETTYPNARVLLMEENYRSTEEIVQAANLFVARNRFRREKTIRATRGSGDQVQRIFARNRAAQYKYLFEAARDCCGETAVLFRNNDSALPLIDMLERGRVSYNCRKFDEAFFSHRVISDLKDIIRFAQNPSDCEIFLRIYYKLGLYLTKAAAAKACEASKKSGKAVLEEVRELKELPKSTRESVCDTIDLLDSIPKDSAVVALNRIWHTMRYEQYVLKNHLDAGKFDILLMLARREQDADSLLMRLEELRTIIQEHQNRRENNFILSTIHSSKGLEYDSVYLLDVFDGIFPSKTVQDLETAEDEKAYEEERRLYYVGMTRAKKKLYLFACGKESSFTSEVLGALPREIVDPDDVFASLAPNLLGKSYTDQNRGKGFIIAQCGEQVLLEYQNGETQLCTLVDLWKNRSVRYAKPDPKAPIRDRTKPEMVMTEREAAQMSARIETGTKVAHIVFGEGVVAAVNGDIVTVRFDADGETRRLMLSAAMKNRLLYCI